MNIYASWILSSCLVSAWVTFMCLFLSGENFVASFEVFSLGQFFLSLDFVLDKESFLFFMSLGLITGGVASYSTSYMASEKYFNRFMGVLFLFVVSMIILIFSANLFSVMIGWDGLGVTSFLLVIFFQNKNSTNAGLLTVFTNRIGDVFIMSAMSLLLVINSWGVSLFSKSGLMLPASLGLLLVVAAFTKSAQIPFSSWLPAAMAAPTPVSSLVHSSTLVTAGVYLVFRFKDVLLSSSSTISLLLLSAGSATMVMAGGSGLYEDDLKKMVALSTLSQLGLMMACLGLGAPSLAFFHLLSHAYFKALLFMVTGSMIHSMGNYQDLRLTCLPYSVSLKSSSLLLVSNLSLMGFPFLSGFYSKDMVLELCMSSSVGSWVGVMFIMGTAMTVLYSFRFILLSGGSGVLHSSLSQHMDLDWSMYRGYDFLFVLALGGGGAINHIYLSVSPFLLLSFELKNFVLVLILFSSVAYLLNWVFPPQALKFSLSSLLNIGLLSKSFFKVWLFNSLFINEKLVEKLLFKSSMFSFMFKTCLSMNSFSTRSFLVFMFVCSVMGSVLIFS